MRRRWPWIAIAILAVPAGTLWLVPRLAAPFPFLEGREVLYARDSPDGTVQHRFYSFEQPAAFWHNVERDLAVAGFRRDPQSYPGDVYYNRKEDFVHVQANTELWLEGVSEPLFGTRMDWVTVEVSLESTPTLLKRIRMLLRL